MVKTPPSPENTISGLVRPKGYQRLRNVLHVATMPDGSKVMKAWPRKRGPTTDPAQLLRQARFAVRRYYAHDPIDIDNIMARLLTAGSPFLPGDILYKQQVGTLCEVITQSGTYYRSLRLTQQQIQAELDSITNTIGAILYRDKNGWVGLAPGQPNQVLTAQGAGNAVLWSTAGGGGSSGFLMHHTNAPTSKSASNAATQGAFLYLTEDMAISSVLTAGYYDPTQSYKIGLATVGSTANGSPLLTYEDLGSFAATVHEDQIQQITLPAAITLTNNTIYALTVTRTDSNDSAIVPTDGAGTTTAWWTGPVHPLGGFALASKTPAPGQPITSSGYTPPWFGVVASAVS